MQRDSVNRAVHPRVCGERVKHSRAAATGVGSSPRVRGTLTSDKSRRFVVRFIPACAGNALTSTTGYFAITVHPRVCGERLSGWIRGAVERRFIPACAGNAPPS